MKKFLLIIVMLFTMSISANAQEYDVKSANMKIAFPDDWYVFTRENIEDNEGLNNIGVTTEYMNNFFEANSAYIDAIKSNLEFVLRTTDYVDFASLSNYPDAKVEEFAKDFGAINKTEDQVVYNNKYKYILLNSVLGDYHMNIYATVINHRWYTFTIQKKNEFTADEKIEIKKIIDSIEYEIVEIDPEEQKKLDEQKKIEEQEKNSNQKIKQIVVYIIIVMIVIGIVGSLILFKKRKQS